VGDAPCDGTFNDNPVPTGPYVYVVQPIQNVEDFVRIVT